MNTPEKVFEVFQTTGQGKTKVGIRFAACVTYTANKVVKITKAQAKEMIKALQEVI